MSARASGATVFIGCLLLVASTLRAQTSQFVTDGVRLPDRSVTTESGAQSVEVNPAGLGFMESIEARYTLELDAETDNGEDLPFTDQHAAFAAGGTDWFGLGLGFQWLDRPVVSGPPIHYQKYSLALALRPFENVSFGGGLNFFGTSQDRQLNDLTSLDLGAMWRPSQYFGFGLALRDTNPPYLRPERGLPLRIQPGAAFRLLDGRFVVDSQLSWVPREDTIAYSPRLDITPVDGLRFFGRARFPFNSDISLAEDTPTRFVAGLEFSLGEVGLASGAMFRSSTDSDDDGYSGQTQSVWVTPQTRPSLVPPKNRWVRVDLGGNIAERAVNSPFAASKRSFLDLLLHVRELADDPSVAGVVFEVGPNDLGYGQAWEIRREIEYLNDAGTTTAIYLTQPDFTGAYLASAADKTYLMPAEPYAPQGVRASMLNYAEALSNIGIKAEFLRIGDYKSAPETFVRREPSKADIEQTTTFIDTIYDEVVSSIADERGLDRQDVVDAIDSIPILPDRAVERGFADKIVYPDEIRPHLAEEYGASNLLGAGYDPTPAPRQGWDGGPEVAVVYIDGSIVRGPSSNPPLFGDTLSGSETITRVLEDLGRDPNVRAIVIRVDSPGGSAVASDLIYRQIRRVAQVKPVVASMGDIAASGGYYVAAGADTIFATPNTLTGSIGIFSGKFSIGQLADLIGINHTEIQRGKRNGQFGLFDEWSDPQRESVSESIHYLYRLFLQQAAETRPLSADEIDKVARGRIWVAQQAKEKKLVDKLGGLVDAIHYAESKAGIRPGTADYHAYPTPGSFLEISPFTVGVLGKIGEFLGLKQKSDPRVDGFLAQLLDRVQRAVLLPLLYDAEEPLMLPPKAIVIE